MKGAKGTSWLLGGGYPWPPARTATVPGARALAVTDSELGLSLSALPAGPFGLESGDGSLGRLTLPLGVAVSGDRVFVLSSDGARVFAYDSEHRCLRTLTDVGADGLPDDAPSSAYAEPRRFRNATNIAAFGTLLYVTDPAARRVQVFDWTNGALVRIHAGLESPVDVAAGRGGVYILDAGRARVWLARPHRATLTLVASVPERARRWTRLAVDRDERLYLRDVEPSFVECEPDRAMLDVVVPSCRRPTCSVAERIGDAGAIRSRFDTPAVWSSTGAVDDLPRSGDCCDRAAERLPTAVWRYAMLDRITDLCHLSAPLEKFQRAFAIGDRHYLLDRQRRVVELRDALGRRVRRFGPLDANGNRSSVSAPDAWSPVDVTSFDGCALILDERNQVVYADEPGSVTLRRRFAHERTGAPDWHRLAADDCGALLLWDGGSAQVDRFDAHGRALGTVPLRDVRRWFGRAESTAPAPRSAGDVRIARDGRVSLARHDGLPDLRRTYELTGTWISDWLDSDIYQCQWHLVELAIAELPPGSRISVHTRTSNDDPSPDDARHSLESLASAGSWSEALTITAPTQPTDTELKRAKLQDLLVQSGPGQYLQLLVELTSDGLATPRVERVRLRYPYASLREFLPALYSAPEEQRQFLDRYLGLVQRTWDEIESTVTSFERYLDADTVPAGVPMQYLASWMGIQLEGTWTADQNRRLFSATRDALPHWGTPDALRKWIAAHLETLSGVGAKDIDAIGVPGIVEGFVERRRLMLGRADTARLGSAEPLWSPGVERRFQIGVYDQEGEVELVSVGDPALDVFRHSAHRFRVYVPSAWVRTAAQEALLRRAIAAQTPAHTSYELVLVAPRFRVGVQSTVALDTVIGAPTTAGLACPTDDEPASRPPHERLGFDLVLGAGGSDAALGSTDLILA